MLSAYVPKGRNNTNFVLFDFIFAMPISMAMPKANNDHLFWEKYEFLQPGIYLSEELVKPMNLTRIT